MAGTEAGTVVVSLPDKRWIDLVGPIPAVRAVVWDADSDPRRAGVLDTEFLVPPYMKRADWSLVNSLPRLRVVQTLTAGYEDAIANVSPKVTLCHAAGVHDASTSELAVGLILAQLRGIPAAVRASGAARGRWQPRTLRSLADRRVLVVGAGGLGTAIAARLEPFEVSLTRVASRARDDGRGHVHAVTELPALLPEQDVAVLACSLNESTRGLADARFLAAMPDGSLLVNVARGAVVDTDALLRELHDGRLLAALDVVEPEPLPDAHPLWSVPGVLLTPHLGGNTSAFKPRAAAFLRDQIARFAAGDTLRAIVAGPAAPASPSEIAIPAP
ncbi:MULTISPECIES: 2-hydroxyacid dehydrogenase [Protofrankia]|uniref:Hydroxyacid dehydrogenase n=1 Tax=Protofrankia coriariae TaxID=1562887 RepID=A0ABR5F3D9_9ACTN|nr:MULTISPECIES: 2-hydroxyacid dehydrogenase [Protofrankia]KLL11228.1 hydroxyacid dehydrogenase [Protofrankia coriariae]ONH33748.1 hydroxyacid dehydrogenase [Protofrankia sp. BMG5.30]